MGFSGGQRSRTGVPPGTLKEEKKMTSRIISGIIAVGYLVAAYLAEGGAGTLRLAGYLILPLACIWFSEAMGDYVGASSGTGPIITRTTPGCFVAFGGWMLLLLPVIIGLIVYLSGHG